MLGKSVKRQKGQTRRFWDLRQLPFLMVSSFPALSKIDLQPRRVCSHDKKMLKPATVLLFLAWGAFAAPDAGDRQGAWAAPPDAGDRQGAWAAPPDAGDRQGQMDMQRGPIMLAATLPPPLNIAAIASDGAVCLQWQRPRIYQLGWGGISDHPIVSYTIDVTPEFSGGPSQSRLQRFFTVPLDAPTEARVTGLANGYSYRFTVSAEVRLHTRRDVD
jgi:hypothetical protein